MFNANHLIHCRKCGTEFRSAFAGAMAVMGCTETCPICGAPIATPTFMDGLNIERLQRASDEPMMLSYGLDGEDGTIFMGARQLGWHIRSPSLLPTYAAYDRNFSRVLNLIEILYKIEVDDHQLLLGTILCAVMTAYESFTNKLLKAYEIAGFVPAYRNKLSLADKRMTLFRAQGIFVDNRELLFLYAIRNCLQHNAGIIDADYLRVVQAIDGGSAAPDQNLLGQPLVLNASGAISFADSLQQLAHAMFVCAQSRFEQEGI